MFKLQGINNMSLPDPLDQASHHDLMDTASSIESYREAAKHFDPGTPGHCQECGIFYTRIVRRLCCRCRDRVNK